MEVERTKTLHDLQTIKEGVKTGSSLVSKQKQVWESLKRKRRRSACIRKEEDPRISVIHYSGKKLMILPTSVGHNFSLHSFMTDILAC